MLILNVIAFSKVCVRLLLPALFIIFAVMISAYQVSQFEAKLEEIYNKSSWLRYELSLHDFINLFPVKEIQGRPLRLDRPQGLELDRDTFLAILVAFRQSFG